MAIILILGYITAILIIWEASHIDLGYSNLVILLYAGVYFIGLLNLYMSSYDTQQSFIQNIYMIVGECGLYSIRTILSVVNTVTDFAVLIRFGQIWADEKDGYKMDNINAESFLWPCFTFIVLYRLIWSFYASMPVLDEFHYFQGFLVWIDLYPIRTYIYIHASICRRHRNIFVF